jgi:hypothetical protein
VVQLGTREPKPTLFGLGGEGAGALLKALSPLPQQPWVPALAAPAHPYLVANDQQPAPSQMTEDQFLGKVADHVSELEPRGVKLQTKLEAGLALRCLGVVADGLRPLFPLEAGVRKVLGADPDAALDPEQQATALAELLATTISSWYDLPEREESYTPDVVKQAALAAAVLAPLPANVAQLLASISEDRPEGTFPSSGGFGRRIHTFIQLAYVGAHPLDNVICDGRWTFTAVTTTVGWLLRNLTGAQLLDFTPKLGIYIQAMGTGSTAIRPDICDLDEDTLYEIKPRGAARDAVKEVWGFYLPEYNKAADAYNRVAEAAGLPRVDHLKGGEWPPPPLYYDPDEQAFATIANQGLGAIVYDVYRVPAEALEALAAFLITVAMVNALMKMLEDVVRSNLPGPPPLPALDPEIVHAFYEGLVKTIVLILMCAMMMIMAMMVLA